MSQTAGNTAEPSGDNTAPPDTPSGMQIHQVLARIDQCIGRLEQDAAQNRQAADRVYGLVSQFETAPSPFTDLAVALRASGDTLMKAAGDSDQEADGVKQVVSEYREYLDMVNKSHNECDPIFANMIMEVIERTQTTKCKTSLFKNIDVLEKHCENFDWLMVVESIVRPTNESD